MIQIKQRMPVTFETPPGARDKEIRETTTERSKVDSKSDKIENDNATPYSESLPKLRQTKVIDNCSHGTQTLENRLRLKGAPIAASASVIGVTRSLIVQIVITITFCCMEFVTGILCASIAMLADSYHMAADVMALIVALICIKIATRPSTRHGYGWVRAETLGGFFNGIFMITVCLLVFQEGIGRVIHVRLIHNPIQVVIIGFFGLLINIIGMFNLSGHGHAHGGGDSDHGHSHDFSVFKRLFNKKGCDDDHDHDHDHDHKDEHDHEHEHDGHGHSHSHEAGCSDKTPVGNGNIRRPTENVRSDAITRLLDEEEGEEIVERRLSGVTNQSSIIAAVDRQMTPYGTHIASEVLNSTMDLEDVKKSAKKKKDKNVNIHGVWLHLLSDALGSVIVIFSAGVVFFWPNLKIAPYLDPCLSLCLATIMGFTAIVLVKTSGEKLLKRTPQDLNLEKVKKDLCSIVGVSKVEKLSVWTLCGQRIIASAHVNFCHPAVFADAAFKIKKYFHDMGVHSTTIEPTFEDTCMQSMTVTVKKVVNQKSVEESFVTVTTEDELQQTA